MDLEIIWSAFAEEQLDKIYIYYLEKAGLKIALKLLKNILTTADILLINPHTGQKEDLLSDRIEEYRYLVYKNYKNIYSINSENKFIEIADVFNTLQNPVKITRKK